MVTELNGSDDRPGLIKQLDDELQKPVASKSNLTIAGLKALNQSIEIDLGERRNKQEELSKASQQVSFKQLYEAVTQLRESSPEQCPACQTPLSQVIVNPFEHATAELKKLEHLGQLQEILKKLEGDIGTSLTKLSEIINACCSIFPDNNPLSAFKSVDENAVTVDCWHSLHQKSEGEFTPWQHVEAQVKHLEDADNVIDLNASVRTEKQAELKRLREFAEKVVKLQTRRRHQTMHKRKPKRQSTNLITKTPN